MPIFKSVIKTKKLESKNEELADTIDQLAKAKVGKRASTIMLTVAVVLFILEQIFIEPIIEENFGNPFVSLGALGNSFLLINSLKEH